MDYQNKTGKYYTNNRTEMANYFPDNAKTVLDVGCGQGIFAKYIKGKYNTITWGIEYMPDEAKEAMKVLDKVFLGPCEDFIDEIPDNFFDVIYFNDVLEHLVDPYMVLEKIKQKLTANGRIISSIPNIRYHNSLRMFLFGKDWKYEESGVMDHTHMRFFTKKSIRRMYEDLGFKIVKHEGINKSRSLKPYFINALFLFSAFDIFYTQFASVVEKE
jgi:2-polyprenyl-3-methyl-5-hydroxy-6-metoxy-1,4-benzoquinol methylase